MAQTGGGFRFDERVFGGNGERTGFPISALWLGQGELIVERKTFDRLLGIKCQVVALLDRFDQFDGEDLNLRHTPGPSGGGELVSGYRDAAPLPGGVRGGFC